MSSIATPKFTSEPYIEAIGYNRECFIRGLKPELFFPSLHLRLRLRKYCFRFSLTPKNKSIDCVNDLDLELKTYSFQVDQQKIKDLFTEWENAISKPRAQSKERLEKKIDDFFKEFNIGDGKIEVAHTKPKPVRTYSDLERAYYDEMGSSFRGPAWGY